VATQLMSEASSDSDHGGSCDTCDCKAGGQCHCATPRGGGKGKKSTVVREASTSNAGSMSTAASSLHRIPEGSHYPHLRPVLPRPSPGVPTEPSVHSPPPGHFSPSRQQVHGSMYYSPYGRAYEQAHIPGAMASGMLRPVSGAGMVASQDTVQQEFYQMFTNAPRSMSGQDMAPQMSWPSPNDASFPLCNCGDSCACPGCLEHRGPNAAGYLSFQTCSNPNSCSSCLSCSILSLPYEASATGFNDPQSYQFVDELLARIPDVIGRSPQASTSNTLAMSQQVHPSMMQGYMNGQAQAWPDYFGSGGGGAVSTSCGIGNMGETRSECCGGQCKCPPGQCSCPPDCCGCCQGCACGHDEDASRGGLTFAVSGERSACCLHHRSREVQGGMLGASQFSNYGAPSRTASSSTQSSRSTSYQNPYAPSTSTSGSGSCCSARNIPRSS